MGFNVLYIITFYILHSVPTFLGKMFIVKMNYNQYIFKISTFSSMLQLIKRDKSYTTPPFAEDRLQPTQGPLLVLEPQFDKLNNSMIL